MDCFFSPDRTRLAAPASLLSEICCSPMCPRKARETSSAKLRPSGFRHIAAPHASVCSGSRRCRYQHSPPGAETPAGTRNAGNTKPSHVPPPCFIFFVSPVETLLDMSSSTPNEIGSFRHTSGSWSHAVCIWHNGRRVGRCPSCNTLIPFGRFELFLRPCPL